MLRNSEDFWRETWGEHMPLYRSRPPRQGMYLELLFPEKSWTFLELAAGSMRDANYLAERGYQVTGSDYVPEVVSSAREAYRDSRLETRVIDAFDTKVADDTFDVSYHNGLLICFSSDSDIEALVREQARITRKYMVATVPCAYHEEQRRQFAELAPQNPIYDIRWLTLDDISRFLAPYGCTKVYPFGGRLDSRLLPGRSFGWLPLCVRRWVYRSLCPHQRLRRWKKIIAVTQVGDD